MEAALGKLQKPIAIVVPDESIEDLSQGTELEIVQSLPSRSHRRGTTGEDPLVFFSWRCLACRRGRHVVERHEDEAAGVPKLGDETAPLLVELLKGKTCLLSIRAGVDERITERVRPDGFETVGKVLLDSRHELIHVGWAGLEDRGLEVFGCCSFDHCERVDPIALALAHHRTLVIEHGGMDVDVAIGKLAGQFEPREVHARHPEKDDVLGGG